MRQYHSVKQQFPGTLLLFRLGDFYELFFEDAVTAARELEITLTARNKEKGAAIPMCGVPYHAADGYVSRLLQRGYRIAICDQVEDPKLTKKIVRREVTRVLSPGTALDAGLGQGRRDLRECLVGQPGRQHGPVACRQAVREPDPLAPAAVVLRREIRIEDATARIRGFAEKLKERFEKAEKELNYAPQFDIILKNNDLQTACREAEELVLSFLSEG